MNSRPGQGSTFKIYLPLLSAISPLSKSPPGVSKLLTGSETILLAEDDDGVCQLGLLALQQHGYTVLRASNGMEALAAAAAHEGTIHILITDVVMPKMGGRELASRLRAERPGVKVLFLSGYTNDTLAHEGGLEAGAAFMHKPFTPTTLCRKVREMLDPVEE